MHHQRVGNHKVGEHRAPIGLLLGVESAQVSRNAERKKYRVFRSKFSGLCYHNSAYELIVIN